MSTARDYVSYFFSEYHPWFVELGYPLLDVIQFSDGHGEWGIIQCQTMPIVPSITKWKVVLSEIKNVEISFSFIEKWTAEIDLQRKAFWDREDAKTKALDVQEDATDRHREDMVRRAHLAITRNPALMERIAKNGIQEMDLDKIRKHIPKHKLR